MGNRKRCVIVCRVSSHEKITSSLQDLKNEMTIPVAEAAGCTIVPLQGMGEWRERRGSETDSLHVGAVREPPGFPGAAGKYKTRNLARDDGLREMDFREPRKAANARSR